MGMAVINIFLLLFCFSLFLVIFHHILFYIFIYIYSPSPFSLPPFHMELPTPQPQGNIQSLEANNYNPPQPPPSQQNRVVCILDIFHSDTQQGKIIVHELDDPKTLADKFADDNDLEESYRGVLEKHILQNMASNLLTPTKKKKTKKKRHARKVAKKKAEDRDRDRDCNDNDNDNDDDDNNNNSNSSDISEISNTESVAETETETETEVEMTPPVTPVEKVRIEKPKITNQNQQQPNLKTKKNRKSSPTQLNTTTTTTTTASEILNMSSLSTSFTPVASNTTKSKTNNKLRGCGEKKQQELLWQKLKSAYDAPSSANKPKITAKQHSAHPTSSTSSSVTGSGTVGTRPKIKTTAKQKKDRVRGNRHAMQLYEHASKIAERKETRRSMYENAELAYMAKHAFTTSGKTKVMAERRNSTVSKRSERAL